MNQMLGAILFVTLFSVLFYGMQYYVFARIRRLFYFQHKKRYYFYVLGMTFLFPVIMVISNMFWNWFVKIIYISYMVYLGTLFLAFIILLIHQLLALAVKIPKRAAQVSMVLILLSLVIFSLINATLISVKEVEIPASNIKNNITIVQLTDLHLGQINNKKYFEDVIIKTNSLNPDLVVITGDFVESSDILTQDGFNLLNNIKSPSLFVIGNHETFGDLEKTLSMIRKTKTQVLINETVSFEDIQIIGIEDVTRVNKNKIDSILGNITYSDEYTVLLSHEPLDFSSIEKYPINLQISGHTHDGQIFPFNLIIKYIELPLVVGIYQQGNQTTYVSPGTGTWGPPMRLGSDNEITVIKLVK